MQRHSIEHRSAYHLLARCTPIPANSLENRGVHPFGFSPVGDQKWSPDRDPNFAQHLRGSRFPVWQSSPQGRICVFYFGAALAFSYIPCASKIGEPSPKIEATTTRRYSCSRLEGHGIQQRIP